MRNQTIIVDINKEVCKILRYKQYDNNNILQIIVEENYKKINLDNYIGFAFFQLPSGLIIKKDCEIQENVITIIVDNSILSEDGTILLDLTLSDGEEVFTLFRINLVIEGTIDRDEAVIIQAGWDILAEIAKFDLAERQRCSNEEQREMYEEQRRIKEDERLTNEINRQNEELKRVANETERLINEEERIQNEKIRKNNENERQENYNVFIENIENNEVIRQENETERIQAENVRQSGYVEFKNEVSEELDNVNSQLAQNTNDLNILNGRKVNVLEYSHLVVDNDWTNVIQNLIDNNDGRVIYFPKGEYKITDTIFIPGQNTYELHFLGDGDASIIKLDNTEEGKAMFCMKGIAQYKNRYKTFERLSFKAHGAELQTFLTWQPYSDTNAGTESPFRVKNCTINTSGYNINLDQCPWIGDSYVKECNCLGGGFMYVKPAKKYWIGNVYPHSFSNLVIEDIHFSTSGGKPRYSLLYLEGAQNTYIKNLTLEGSARYFNPNYTDLGKAGSYITVVGGSVTFDTLWCEHGDTDNVTSKYAIAIWGLEGSHSTNPSQVVFNNCYHMQSPIFVGFPNGASGIYANATINYSAFLNTDNIDDVFDVVDGGYLYLDNCCFRNHTMVNRHKGNTRIRFTNATIPKFKSNTTQGVGDLIGSSSDVNDIVYYQYKGGLMSNDTTPLTLYSTWGNHLYNYPHYNPKYGHSIISKNQGWSGHYTGCATIPGYSNVMSYDIEYPCTVYINLVVRTHHHETRREKGNVTNFNTPYVATSIDSINTIFRAVTVENSALAYSQHYYWLEILDVNISNKPMFANKKHYKADCINVPELFAKGGTWIKGDKIESSYLENTQYTKICSKNGTSRTINVNGIIGESGDIVYIPIYTDLINFLGGEHIKINDIEYVVLDYFYGEDDTKNYIQLDKSTGLSASTSVTIVNSPPEFKTVNYS